MQLIDRISRGWRPGAPASAWRRLVLGAVLAVMAAQTIGVSHVHGQDAGDTLCVACSLGHHGAAAAQTLALPPVPGIEFAPVAQSLCVDPCPGTFSHYDSRAPPDLA